MSIDFTSFTYYIPPDGDAVNFGSIPTEYNAYVESLTPLISYHRLGESSGSTVMVDETGNHDGTYESSPVLEETGSLVDDTDTAMRLVGSNDHAEVPHHTDYNINTFSISLFIKVTTSPTSSEFVAGKTTGSTWIDGWGLAFRSDGNLRFFINHWDNNKVTIPSADCCDGDWHHIVCTYDQVNIKIYLDGTIKDTYAYTTAITNTSTELSYGISPTLSTEDFIGSVDEVSIHSIALDYKEVSNLYNLSNKTNFHIWYDDLILNLKPTVYYRLGESVGSTIAEDISGNDYDGTYTSISSSVLGSTGLIVDDPNTSVYFTGASSERVDFSTEGTFISSTSSWSVSCSYLGSSTNSLRALFQLKTDTSTGIVLYQSANKLYFNSDYAGTNFQGFETVNTCLNSSANSSIIVVFDGVDSSLLSSYKLYVDGVEIEIKVRSPSGTDNNTHNCLATFYHSSYATFYASLGGTLDEFAIFNYELSLEHINWIYYKSIGSEPVSLISYLMLGDTLIEKPYLGITDISKIYLGDNLVYSK